MRFPVTAARILVTLLGRTWRIETLKATADLPGERVLYSLWHGSQLPLLFTHRDQGLKVLVSRSRDGGILAALLHSIGYGTVRGSSSRGGAQAVADLCAALQLKTCAITPDGPRGPREVPKDGLFIVAKRAGVPVKAIGAAAWPALRLSSWDRFLVPLPFCRVTVAEGVPIPPGRLSRVSVNAEMGRVSALAELAVSPVAGIQAFAAGAAAALALPVLCFRPRRERKERLGYAPVGTSSPAWLHGSSLGELRGLLPVASILASRGVPVHVTCFTPSGRDFIDREGFTGSFLPLDTPSCVRRFLFRVKPRCLILAETELWPCLLRETVLAGIPAGMVNARMGSKGHKRYTPIRRTLAGSLSCFAGILARTDNDAAAFRSLGVRPGIVTVAGDGKAAVAPEGPEPCWSRMLLPDRDYVVAGSTRPGEEEFVLKAAALAGMGVILAPRHAERVGEALAAATALGFTPGLFSRADGPSDCMVIDTQGVLSRVYALGKAAFLGGTVAPVGGHNILEPLSQGLPVVVGPHHGNHGMIVAEGVERGIVGVALTPEEMAGILMKWSGSPDLSGIAVELASAGSLHFQRELSALLEGLML
ncbi:MAG: glycosyltransferase N-terminal domain-containing protein [Candidatus Fermentibacteraceae bacterium]